MTEDCLKAELLSVRQLFAGSEGDYTIPVYQRNFAWGAEQIEQLISDVQDAQRGDGYFLGNLVVTERAGSTTEFVVIDGQQRLTTLYLLLTVLAERGGEPFYEHTGRLRYQSRPRATDALRRISAECRSPLTGPVPPPAGDDAAIEQGYNVVQQFLDQHIEDQVRDDFADFLRDRVTLVRVSLPPSTDLNRYFEVMNTRGQQLAQVDIVKAGLMSRLDDPVDQACFAWIWEACADMDSYVQMTLTRADTAMRGELFGEKWTWLTKASFDELRDARAQTGVQAAVNDHMALDVALRHYGAKVDAPEPEDSDDNVRFRSTIEFPVFLLHVLRVHEGDGGESEGSLDDKQLVRRFSKAFGEGSGREVQRFAHLLLRCRNLFDAFILKRQYTAKGSDDGEWSLQRITKRSGSKAGYINTFRSLRQGESIEEDGDVDSGTADVLLLESMLRVTYTSPRTMHWMTEALRFLAAEEDPGAVTARELGELLRRYARDKVQKAFFDVQPQPTGFAINRIVFTYLDYLLAVEGGKASARTFTFSFRNSIEHFYPRSPDEQMSGCHVSPDRLDLLGNLALVSVGVNSKFSNSLPHAKAVNFRDTIVAQSPKLGRMAEIARKDGWCDEQVDAHHREVIELLRQDLGLDHPRR